MTGGVLLQESSVPFRRSPLLLLPVALLALGLGLGPGVRVGAEPGSPSADLTAAVRAYLEAQDEAHRTAAAAALKPFDEVPVAQVREVLRALAVYAPVKGPETFTVAHGKWKLTCRVVPPANYDPAKSYPLLFSMWGPSVDGQAGVRAWSAAKDWFVASVDMPADNPVLKGYAGHDTGPRCFGLALPDLLRRYHIDPDRVFATGFSMGGGFVWYIAGFLPDRVAGGLVVAAMSLRDIPNLPPGTPSPNRSVFNVPLYIIHGAKDPTEATVDSARAGVAELKALGYKYVYHEYPNGGHDWPPAEELQKVLAWFGELRRQPRPRRVVAVTAAYMNPWGRFFWVQLASGKPGMLDFEGEIGADNRIEIKTAAITKLELLLGDDLIDPAQEVVVVVNGREVFRGKVARSLRTALDSFLADRDPERIHTVRLPVDVP